MSIFQIPRVNNTLNQNHFKIKFSEETQKNYICKTLSIYLNKVKGRINKYSIEWDNFKKITNNYEYIHTTMPNSKNSVSKLKPLSRAFYKLVEINNHFDILNKFDDNIRSFHLAEGPGGFIEATNFLRKNENDIYHGITLIDDENDNIPGWRKSHMFLRKTKQAVIENGVDGFGNLYNPENFKHYTRAYKNSIDFITADGGFDFSIDFNNQEKMALRLIFTEVLYAIMMQKKGGTFVIKMFDIFLKSSVDILYILSTMYEKVSICKPNTSRTANSERYIICLNFKYEHNDHLYHKFHTILKVLNHKSMQKSFIESILDISIPYKFKQNIEEIQN